jgi:hypothetical protein
MDALSNHEIPLALRLAASDAALAYVNAVAAKQQARADFHRLVATGQISPEQRTQDMRPHHDAVNAARLAMVQGGE